MTANDRTPGRLSGWERLGIGLVVAAIVVGFVWLLLQPALLGSLLGDPAKEVLAIDNRTDQRLLVYHVYFDGSEHPTELVPPIPPRSRIETGLPCGAGELAARTRDGELVARRGPFDECNLEDWIIGPGG